MSTGDGRVFRMRGDLEPARSLLSRCLPLALLGLMVPGAGELTAQGCGMIDAAAPPEQLIVATDDPVDDLRRSLRRGLERDALNKLRAIPAGDQSRLASALLEVFRADRPALLPAARRALGTLTEEDALTRVLREGLGGHDARTREQVILALAESRPDVVDWRAPVAQALTDREAGVRAAAVHAVGRARISARLGAILDMAQDPSERVRAAVPGSLVRLAGPRSVATLEQLASDPRWRVRLAALTAIGDLRSQAGLELLVDALGRETGRLREDIAALLRRQTGRTYGPDVGAWRWHLKRTAEGGDVAQGDTDVRRYVDDSIRSYHLLPTASQRMALATDCSASMGRAAPLAARPGLELATQELQRFIGTLDESVAFTLVDFADRSHRWKQSLAVANARTRRAAQDEVAKYRAGGETNVYAAVSALFDLAESSLDDPFNGRYGRSPEIDTLFLLSDGQPTTGAITDPELLVEYVAERNRSLQLRIHGVSFRNGANDDGWLRRVTELTGGSFVRLDGGSEEVAVAEVRDAVR